jgi:hypothetical protein
MPNSPQSSGHEFLDFDPPHQRGGGLYRGDAYFSTPSGKCIQLAVYRDHGRVIFGAIHDPTALSPGTLLHETQIALRAVLRAACPELCLNDVDDPDPEAAQ